jgi:hypothetical protein
VLTFQVKYVKITVHEMHIQNNLFVRDKSLLKHVVCLYLQVLNHFLNIFLLLIPPLLRFNKFHYFNVYLRREVLKGVRGRLIETGRC